MTEDNRRKKNQMIFIQGRSGAILAEEQIVDLYRAAGWWKEEMDASKINDLIRGSFLFAVAIDISTGRAVGMGRVISDGIADAYIQDLVVLGRLEELGCGENDSQLGS